MRPELKAAVRVLYGKDYLLADGPVSKRGKTGRMLLPNTESWCTKNPNDWLVACVQAAREVLFNVMSAGECCGCCWFPVCVNLTRVSKQPDNWCSASIFTKGIFRGFAAVRPGMLVAVGVPGFVKRCFFCCRSSKIFRLFSSETAGEEVNYCIASGR